MEPEGRYTLIGALVLLLAAITFVALIWLGGYSRQSQRLYTVYFERQSLLGIQVGGNVNIRGLKVGQIDRYVLSPGDVNRVKVNIRLDGNHPVNINTTAVISRSLVTSVAWIDLQTPNPPGALLTEIPDGETYPVIPEGSSDMDAFSDAFNRIALTGEQTLQSLNGLLNQHNRDGVSQMIASLRDLTSALPGRLALVDAAAEDLSQTADSVQASVARIATALDRTAGAINRSVAPLTTQASAAIKDLRGLFEEVRNTVTHLDETTTKTMNNATEAADIGLLELRATTRELRTVVDSLSRTLDRLADPRATILGPGEAQLGPGER